MLCHNEDCDRKAECIAQAKNVYYAICTKCATRIKTLAGSKTNDGWLQPIPRTNEPQG